jgi:hypothetical protein
MRSIEDRRRIGRNRRTAGHDQRVPLDIDRPVRDHQRCERARDRHGRDRGIGAPRDRDRRDGEARECDQREAVMVAREHQRGGGDQEG